jgi:hypothetical protein
LLGAGLYDAGVVDQDVNCTPTIDNAVDKSTDFRWLRYVAMKGMGIVSLGSELLDGPHEVVVRSSAQD